MWRGKDNEEGGGGGGGLPYTTESKSAMCHSVSIGREEGTGDCEDLLIREQWWVEGFWIGQYNEANLKDCIELIHTPLMLVLLGPAKESYTDLYPQLMPVNPSAPSQVALNLELDSLMTV